MTTEQQSTGLSFDERMEMQALAQGKTSLLYQVPNGNCWLFVSKREIDVKTAFLKGMIDVMIARGMTGVDGPITIRRVEGGLIVPGQEVYWQVNDENGETIAKGYCRDEQQAQQEIHKYLL